MVHRPAEKNPFEWIAGDCSGRLINLRKENQPEPLPTEPRWASGVSLLAMGVLYLALPNVLTPGPNWALLVVQSLLYVPVVISHKQGNKRLNRIFGLILVASATIALIWSLAALIHELPSKRFKGESVLTSAVALWMSNMLVFASWYWRLDAGGPHARALREAHTDGAFLFPQMTMKHSGMSVRNWQPQFMDYLFLAFNTSAAFSPTDVPVLSRWAKGLMMIQSFISLGTVLVVAAHAISLL